MSKEDRREHEAMDHQYKEGKLKSDDRVSSRPGFNAVGQLVDRQIRGYV